MNELNKSIGENIYVKLIGEKRFKGILIDVGNDIIVLYNGQDYVYISLYHVQYYKFLRAHDEDILKPDVDSVIKRNPFNFFEKSIKYF